MLCYIFIATKSMEVTIFISQPAVLMRRLPFSFFSRKQDARVRDAVQVYTEDWVIVQRK